MSIQEKRREQVFNQMEDNSIMYIFSSIAPYASEDEKYDFEVNCNFYYLTNLKIENACLVLKKANNTCVAYLYIERYDELVAKWVGARIKCDEAKAICKIQTIEYIDELRDKMGNFIFGMRNNPITVYARLDKQEFIQYETQDISFAKELQANYPNLIFKNLHPLLASLRCIKTSEEIEQMQRAVNITKDGIEAMLRYVKPGQFEYQVENQFNYALLDQGCKKVAFKTIMASGINATVLHYVENDSKIEDNTLVLCDLGATSNLYKADISRTFPANGKFSERQKEIYQAVLDCNNYIIENCLVGTTLAKLNQLSIEFYSKRLQLLGLLENNKTVHDYYFHSIGHMLGLDTHDVALNGNYVLREGNVITVEPGLYIEAESIGVRIEDDILITKDGPVNLSKDILKTIEDIENFMKRTKLA